MAGRKVVIDPVPGIILRNGGNGGGGTKPFGKLPFGPGDRLAD